MIVNRVINVLVINGHPRAGSLSDALATAYVEGASEVGMEVKKIDIRDLFF